MPYQFNITPSPIKKLKKDEYVVGSREFLKQFPIHNCFILDYRKHCSSEIDRVIRECRRNPHKKYYIPKIYCGTSGHDKYKIAPYCLPALMCENVYIPEEFIDIIANRAVNDETWRRSNQIEGELLRGLEDWHARKITEKKYGSFLKILPSDVQNSIREAISSIEIGRGLDSKALLTLRISIEAIRDYMILNGNILDVQLTKKGSSFGNLLKDALANREDKHIGEFVYTIYGLANTGAHLKPGNPNAMNVRERLEQGKEQILATSLIYMMLDVIRWCSTLPQGMLLKQADEQK